MSLVLSCMFFLFKQKTAYEMRMSYWSSDVCSSDLAFVHVDVDHLSAVLHLLAGDIDRARVVAGHDELLERGGTGDVGAFADVDEHGAAGAGGGLGVHLDNSVRVERSRDTLIGAPRRRDRRSTRLKYSHECASRMP